MISHLQAFLHGVHGRAPWHLQPNGPHGRPEEVAVLGLLDGIELGPDELYAVALQDAGLREFHGHVEGRLPAHGWQQRFGPFPFYNHLDDVGRNWLDVSGIGHLGVGHDRSRV